MKVFNIDVILYCKIYKIYYFYVKIDFFFLYAQHITIDNAISWRNRAQSLDFCVYSEVKRFPDQTPSHRYYTVSIDINNNCNNN